MKPTQITELIANIKNTFVSFFSIFMFVALGVGIFLGISWAGPALQNAADTEFDEGAFHHFQVQYPYGLTDDDIEKISQIDGVADVEAGHQSFQTILHPESTDLSVKVQELNKRIDIPIVKEGALPTKANEIALNETAAKQLGYGVGDTITFVEDADNSINLSTASDSTDEAASEETADKDGMKYLNGSTYTVTALVVSPEYLAKSKATYGFSTTATGSIDLLAWVTSDAFDSSAYQDGYPIVDIMCSDLVSLHTFSSEYKNKSAEIEERLTDVAVPLAQARFDDLHNKAQEKVDEAETKLNEGKQKIADGEQQLEEGKATLETKRSEGEAKLASAHEQLISYEVLRERGEAELANANTQITEAEEALSVADAAKATLLAISSDANAYKSNLDAKLASKEITQEEYDKALDEYGATMTAKMQEYANMLGITVEPIDHTNFADAIAVVDEMYNDFENITVEFRGQTMTVAEARVKLAEGRQKYSDALAEYNTKVAQLESGWAQYYAGQEELKRLVAEGEEKIAKGEEELAEAKEKVAENEPKVETAKAQLADMKNSKCAIMSRSYNTGAAEVDTFSEVTGKLSISMAMLFIIVGLLVSYSAVSRIVHEQITQIGTKKALGLRSGEITMSFLLYSGIAVVLGAIAGAIVGILLVEGIIGHVLGGMFVFGNYPPYFDIGLFLAVTAFELVLVLLATWLACRSILKQHAIELLRGEKPPAGKTRFYEKWGIWSKLPLFTQTIVNNCVNDKRRVFSTIVGVAGCTALIVTAITLNNNVLNSYDAHYDDVYGFNGIAYVNTKATDGAIENTQAAFESQGATATPVLRKSFILDLPNGNHGAVRLIVPKDADQFSALYHVNPVSGTGFDPSAEGVWVSQAYAEHYGAKVGDTFTFEDTNGAVYEVPILGINEFWLTYHEVVMGNDYYESLFGKACEPNALLVDTQGASVGDLSAAAASVEGFDSIVDDKTFQHGNFETFSKVSSAVVLIYMALSILMAIVVLLNLNIMFIDEKKRELIVLMINGFSLKDAKRYIYNDTIVLTALGIIAGIVIGCITGSMTVNAVEPSTASFLTGINWPAVLIGIVGSALLAFVMSLISLRRISKFVLTDINKF